MHATLCDLIADLVQNSFEADAAEIHLTIEETEQQLNVVISDNGRGMSTEMLGKIRDPFFTDGRKHRHRKVGLGLPFLFQTAEMTEGSADIQSTEGIGTKVSFSLDRTHVDLPPFGEWAAAAAMLLTYNESSRLVIRRRVNNRFYVLDTKELTEALGDLNNSGSLALLKQFIEGNETDVHGD